ncbi:MAG: hypothetical protein OXI63_13115 [Candidatus Poribacteria bacterium]|nr:hypothetical protein [Candidatus Poribacteria bacterium]
MMQQFNSSVIRIAILAMLISSIMSCGGDDDELVIKDNHLPIKVGNSWTFIDPEYPKDNPVTITITGTTRLSNGKTAFVASDDYSKGYVSRAADDLLLFHEAINDLQGELIYSPPIKVGTTWQGRQGEAEIIAQETVNTPAGIFQNCFRINVRVVDDYDDDYYVIWLAKNVGPIKIAEIYNWDGGIRSTVVLAEFNAR